MKSLPDYPDHVKPSPPGDCSAAMCMRTLSSGERAVRRAMPGSDLCTVHVRFFAKQLLQLAREYRDVDRAQARAPQASDGAKVSTSQVSDAGAYWRPEATAALAAIDDWIGFLVRTVNRERPQGPHIADGARLLQLEFLRRHHALWLARYPQLGAALLEDVKGLNRRAMNAQDTTPVRRVLLKGATCSHEDDDSDYGVTVCGAPLAGLIGTAEPRVLCTVNPEHVVARTEWMAIARA